MPKRGKIKDDSGKIEVQSRKKSVPPRKSELTDEMKSDIRKLIKLMLRKYHDSDHLQERIQAYSSGTTAGISVQEAQEAAAGEIRAYHNSKALTAKIDEEAKMLVDQSLAERVEQLLEATPELNSEETRTIAREVVLEQFDSEQLDMKIRDRSGKVAKADLRKMLLSAFDQYHKSPQLERKIRRISGGGDDNGSAPAPEEIRNVVDRIMETPAMEERIRKVYRSLTEETSINLPVVAPEDLRSMVREEIDADHDEHPIPKVTEVDPERLREIAGEEVRKIIGTSPPSPLTKEDLSDSVNRSLDEHLHSPELRALVQEQAKKAAEKAIAPLPSLTSEDVRKIVAESPPLEQILDSDELRNLVEKQAKKAVPVLSEEEVTRIAEETTVAREAARHGASTEAMHNLIREISGEVARKIMEPLPTFSDLDQAVKAKVKSTAPSPATSDVARQVKTLVQEALLSDTFPEEPVEESPRRRKRVRKKYRR